MKCFKQMLSLMYIPQAISAPADLCQGFPKHLFQEAAPVDHHPGPSQLNGRLGWSRRHLRAPEWGRWRAGDCWLGPWVVVHDHGGVWGSPLLWACRMCAHTEAHAWGCQQGCAGKQVLQQDPSDKDIPALLSFMTVNLFLICEPLPCFPCLKTKGPFRERQSATG